MKLLYTKPVLADVASKTIESSTLGFTSLAVLSTVLLVSIGTGAGLLLVSPAITASIVTVLLTFLTIRHFFFRRRGRSAMDQAWTAARRGGVPDALQLPSTYFLYVLGSGGHTGELCEMVKQQFRPNPRSHRRYLITSGDQHSEHAVAQLEGRIQQAFPSADDGGIGPAGTWDVFRVVRARSVHQPLWSTGYTTVLSALSVVQALVRRSRDRLTVRDAADFNLPHLIVTNGPGTGFVVCLVAHILKLLGLVPASRCAVLYIETWAHVSTLSLTGKLFYHSGIADMYVVQHEALAARTGQRFVGDVAKHGNLLGIKKTLRTTRQPR
ncbi:glycosyltransferase family protein [Grosmannia clavigera kw1407]|uniref:UDP-N-acetylglucosamine transferase subunit ALG14 n=1 Tax=Grosmannia clavigera (strain kw1407 / UAMH 11150) TaxID=655863 RepID=F0X6V1_GROCL|nr:glycosyltransferase family protein [Grosmannia clavigera kw1407]EFX06549.1 glycosyltransferase family protein [Grosmannia clavigera kw1407]